MKFNIRSRVIQRRLIAIGLLSIFLIIIVYALAFVSVPKITTFVRQTNYGDYSNSTLPQAVRHIKYTVVTAFKATGSFSAENPIDVTVAVFGANFTNLLNYFCCIGYFGSVFYPPRFSTADFVEAGGSVFLSQLKNDTGYYVGLATIEYHVETDTFPFLVPQPTYNWSLPFPVGQKLIGTALHIGPISDTLAVRYSDINLRLTWVLVAFSVILLQPIANAILPAKKDQPKQSTDKCSQPNEKPPTSPA